MTALRFPTDHLLPPAEQTTRTVAWWGMVLLCATEAALFAYLIGSYFYLAAQNPGWPPAGTETPKLAKPIIMTVILLSSSAVLIWGERGIKRGDRARLRLGVWLAFLLGAVFLVLQYTEYRTKLRHFGPSSHAYGAEFFTVTGFHGAHVLMGLAILAFTGLRALLGHFSQERHEGVQVSSLYWHFVDVVWLFVFTSLYITPFFTR